MTPDQIQQAILDHLRNVRAEGPMGEQLGDEALSWVRLALAAYADAVRVSTLQGISSRLGADAAFAARTATRMPAPSTFDADCEKVLQFVKEAIK